MPKPTRAEKTVSHVQIQTFGGNTILPVNSEVWVKAGEFAVKKRAADVKPNDLVLEQNTRAEVSLQQIKEALLKDDAQYRMAHLQLHHYPMGGKQVTRLQAFLHHVLGQNKLDSAKLGEGDNRQKAMQLVSNRLRELEARSQTIFGSLKKTIFKRRDETIGRWLSGETVLPSEPQVLRALRKFDSAKFDELFGSPKQLKGAKAGLEAKPLLQAHAFWKTVHSALRNWRAGFSDRAIASENEAFKVPDEQAAKPGEKKPDSKPGRGSLSLEAQRKLVLERLIKPIQQEVDKQYKFIRVKKVVPLKPGQERQEKTGLGEPSPMPKGVVSAGKLDPEKLGTPVKTASVKQIYRGKIMSIHLLTKAFDHVKIDLKKAGGQAQAAETGHGMALFALLDQLKHLEQLPEILTLEDWKTKVNISKGLAVKIGEQTLEQISSGELDKAIGLPEGTLQKIMEKPSNVDFALTSSEHAEAHNLLKELDGAGIWHFKQMHGSKKTFFELHGGKIERLNAIVKKLGKYNIGLVGGMILENDPDFKRKYRADLENPYKFQMQLNLPQETGVQAIPIEMPATKPELQETLQRWGVESKAFERLAELYGERNFIPPRKQH